MWTLVFALLGAFLLARSWAGPVRLPGILAACTFARLGRVHIAAWAYRPGRLYVRVGVV